MKSCFNLCLSLIAFIILSLTTACHKYEEGPGLSLRSKKERMANRWMLAWKSTNYYAQPIGRDEADDIYEFTRNGSYIYTNPGKSSLYGSWDFADAKEYLRIFTSTSPWSATFTEYKIIRLAERELWLREFRSNGDIVEKHFIPAF